MTAAPRSFDPAVSDPRDFREALGRFGTGVTVVTCATENGPLGITANSFASVSLDPPLVLWAPAKSSARYPHFLAARHFAIHIMAAEQAKICESFAKAGHLFDHVAWHPSDTGVPLIDGCLSRFECETTVTHDGGDHTIIVARVARVTTRTGQPLIFFSGAYGGFGTP